jgi:hypothetical protein
MSLLITLNYFLVKGFPETLSIRVVHVLFKGGDASEFDNYRGIMVGPILVKLFAMIFGKRLNNMGCVPRVKLGFAKIIAILTNFSYYGF